MAIDIRNALTVGDCTSAIELSTKLYDSAYSDNDVRMLYASSHACNIGIKLYDLLVNFTSLSFSNSDDVFRAFVKLFPSRSALDTKLQSSWLAIDALQSILKSGVVVGPADATSLGGNNPGSLLYRDRTDDANTYLLFLAMASVGTALNRYGYTSAQTPSALGYHQSVDLVWTTQALVQADTTYAACSLAAAMYNLFDSITATSAIVSSNIGVSLSKITSLLQSATDTAALTNCLVSYPGMNSACNAAIARLRYRGACIEQGPAAAAASGVIAVINAGWL